MRTLIAVVLASLSCAAPLRAQDAPPTPPDSLIEHLVGTWVLEGDIAGQQVTHDVTAAWVLGHEYVRLHEVSRERTAAGAPAYEAILYIYSDAKTRAYAVMWLDNTTAGPFEPIGHAVAAGDSIPFVFGDSDADRIHNTFLYDPRSDSWRWRIDNETAGARTPFARVTLRRGRG